MKASPEIKRTIWIVLFFVLLIVLGAFWTFWHEFYTIHMRDPAWILGTALTLISLIGGTLANIETIALWLGRPSFLIDPSTEAHSIDSNLDYFKQEKNRLK